VRSVSSSKGGSTGLDQAKQVGQEWLSTILSRFGPTTDKATNITTLDFEKPLLELDSRIKEVGVIRSNSAMLLHPRAPLLGPCSQQLAAVLPAAGPQGGRRERGGRELPDCRAREPRAAGTR
jgi:hypothetical protein